MFKAIVLSSLLLCGSVLAQEPPSSIQDPAMIVNNELVRLDTLIQATEQTLEGEKKLRGMIVEYQKFHEQFLKKPEDNELLFKVVKSAHKTLETIKENHLTQTFDKEFIDELTVLAQPATKRGIPNP